MNKSGNNENRILNDKILPALFALAGSVGCTGIMAGEQTVLYTNSFMAFIVWGLSFFVFTKILPQYLSSSKREIIIDNVFGCLLSIALHMGAMLEATDNVDFKSISLYICSICMMIYLAPIVHWLWDSFFRKEEDNKKKPEKPMNFYYIWLVIFLLWIPTFLAFFPGAFVYDATEEYVQVISRQFTVHHPLLHILLLGGIVHLGEYIGLGSNAGIAMYTLFQMLVMSWVFAYTVTAMEKYGVSRKKLLCTVAVVGLFPVFPMYAVCSAKDTLFTGAFLLVVVLLLMYAKEAQKFFDKRIILFVLASVVMMLLRNNGAYAYIVAIVFMIPCFAFNSRFKSSIWKMVVLMILSVILYKGANLCLKVATHATDNENQELLTVPIQQIARVYKYAPEVFSEEELETLHEVLPENFLKTYTPRCSDVLKSGFDNEKYSSNPDKYKKLWMNIGKRKPLIYINAWLVNSYGYWYPDMIINVYGGVDRYTFQYKDSSYFGFETEPPGKRNSLLWPLEELYRKISLEISFQKIPILSMLFAPGFVFYVFAWYIFGLFREKQYEFVGSYIPVFLLWGTVLLGPTILVRYVLILWFVMPLLFVKTKRSEQD